MAIINNNNQIESGLRADVMRKSMETKALLSAKGSIYVGTGESESVGGESIPKTRALPIGSNGQVLTVVNGDLVYQTPTVEHATTADSATYATSAGSATTAESATNASHATSADSATSAGSATNADHATSADSATYATSAGSATTADSATNADHATAADSATTAGSATKATYASDDTSKGTIDDRIDAVSTSYELVAENVRSYAFEYGKSYLVRTIASSNKAHMGIAFVYPSDAQGNPLEGALSPSITTPKYSGFFNFQHFSLNYSKRAPGGEVQVVFEGTDYNYAVGGSIKEITHLEPAQGDYKQLISPMSLILYGYSVDGITTTMDVYEFKQ